MSNQLKPEVFDRIKQYVAVKASIEDFQSRLSSLKKQVDADIETFGVKKDNGSFVLDIDDEATGIKSATRQARRYTALDTDAAEQILNAKGIYQDMVETIEVLSEQKLQQAYADGIITDEELELMFVSSVNYATIIKK